MSQNRLITNRISMLLAQRRTRCTCAAERRHWLPRNSTRRPMTPRSDSELQKVSELLDPFTGRWNVDLIRQHFWEEDVDLILKIPVHPAFSDTIAWHPDAKGLFSVKSAYYLSVINEEEKNNRGEGESSEGRGMQINWKKLWKIQVPNKIKHFLWRLAHNSLAVRRNLRRRGMDVEINCLMCISKDEDTGHLLFKCKHVKRLWQGLDLENLRQVLADKVCAADVFQVILGLKEEDQALVANILWNWWLERNKVREGGAARPTDELVYVVKNQTRAFLEVATKSTVKVPKPILRWQKPVGNWVKINCDGSFLEDSGSGGWGAVMRDSLGLVIASEMGNLPCLLNSFQAEAMAASRGILLAASKGLRYVILETDSVNLKEALLSDVQNLSTAATIIEEIKLLFLSHFISVQIVSCDRSCNAVAHELAKAGRSLTSLHVEGAPDVVMSLVASDLALPTT